VLDLDQSRRARAAAVAREAARERAVRRWFDSPPPWTPLLVLGLAVGCGLWVVVTGRA
jgi:hypothetical protein